MQLWFDRWCSGSRASPADRSSRSLWTNQTHYPYFPNPGGSSAIQATGPGGELLGRYLTALRDSDHAIGNLLSDLQRMGVADSTLVVVVGDHGEAFGQHGRFGHGNTVRELRNMGGNFGHGSDLYEENIHVPMILINSRLFQGEEDSTVGGLVDIAPHDPRPPATSSAGRLAKAAAWCGRCSGSGCISRRHGRAPYLATVRETGSISLTPSQTRTESSISAATRTRRPTSPPTYPLRNESESNYQQMAAWVQYQMRLVDSVMGRARKK